MTKLQRAIEYLDAVELGKGQYAYYAEETSHWYVMPANELAELCDYLDHEDEDIRISAYSHWCAGHTDVEEMPDGWAPEGYEAESPEASRRGPQGVSPMTTAQDANGREIHVGDEVTGGESEEDRDIGVVRAIEGEEVTVAWRGSLETTTQHCSLLGVRR